MSSPPPPNPLPTTTTTATSDFLKSVARQRPRKHSHPAIYQTFYNPQPATTPAYPPPTQRQQPPATAAGVLYPVASSGRAGMVPNSGGFPPRHVSGYPYSDESAIWVLEFGSSWSNFASVGQPLFCPFAANPYGRRCYGGVCFCKPKVKGFGSDNGVAKRLFIDLNQSPEEEETDDQPKLKVLILISYLILFMSSFCLSLHDRNLFLFLPCLYCRDKNGDDAFVIIRDRKVQISEGTSLYAQCRSWLKNGLTVENQPQYPDCVKSLPKPLPASMVEARKEDDIEIEETTEDVGDLSAKELLQQHVKRAKKVRARLRNQRLQKIERYKDRLALLLPPVVDQQPKNDPAS
ncbi:hypothetical protein SSX86_012922 [Deinandra increscens subsp. villosa]|uniref:Uncharacterized protein n=1 Tax=Deinandra increscens subsp. villosa TaxID=3103831 RepID=A0AAP0H138_9ASTR